MLLRAEFVEYGGRAFLDFPGFLHQTLLQSYESEIIEQSRFRSSKRLFAPDKLQPLVDGELGKEIESRGNLSVRLTQDS